MELTRSELTWLLISVYEALYALGDEFSIRVGSDPAEARQLVKRLTAIRDAIPDR